MKPLTVIGIDPGNDSSGVAIRWGSDGHLNTSSGSPWTIDFGPQLRHATQKIRAYVEVPQNGTHSSRGGVHWAAGMIAAQLGLKRSEIRKITPSKWRAHYEPLPKGMDPKEHYVRIASELRPGYEWASHDEAEAYLICLYGLWKETEGK